MASRYWVGGSATWGTVVTTPWSATSGGAGGASVPTVSDDVFLDAASGAVTITIGGNVVCRSLDCTGFTGTLTYDVAGRSLSIGNTSPTVPASNIALKFVAGMTYTIINSSQSIVFATTSTTPQTITWAGKTAGTVTFFGATGRWQIQDAFIATGGVVYSSSGTAVLDINGQICTWGLLTMSTGATKTLTLGAATINMSGGWNGRTGMTITANTATVNTSNGFDNGIAGAVDYNGMSLIYSLGGTPVLGNGFLTTVKDFTFTGSSVKTDSLTLNGNLTVTGTVRLDGNSLINRLLVQSGVVGTQRTLTAATMSASTDNVDFADIAGAGAGNWNLSAKSVGDALGNSGITFPTPVNRYGVVAGSWSSTAVWSATSGGAAGASVPLCHDAVFLNASSASGTYIANQPRMCASIDCTGFTRTLSFNVTTTVYGSFTVGTGMTLTAAGSHIFAGRGNHTITSSGKTWAISSGSNFIEILAPGGTYTIKDNFVMSGTSANNAFRVDAGTFDAADSGANHTVSVPNFQSIGALTRSIIMGTGVWLLANNSAVALWNVTSTGLTLSASGSTITINTSAVTRTFAGGGWTYGTLTYAVAGSIGSLQFTQSAIFDTINFSDATNARSLLFTAGITVTILTAFNISGTAGKLMTIDSATAATHTIAMPAGISRDYLSIAHSTLTGNSAFAGTNSVDGGGNSVAPGWIFGAQVNGNFFELIS